MTNTIVEGGISPIATNDAASGLKFLQARGIFIAPTDRQRLPFGPERQSPPGKRCRGNHRVPVNDDRGLNDETEATMGVLAIGVGAALCGSGAVAHFRERTSRNETLLALGGFCFLLAGLFVTRSGHF